MMVNHNNGDVDSRLHKKEQEKLLFHDFLGSKASASMADHRLPPDKPAKSAVTLTTASASSAGGRGCLCSTSDLIERHAGGGNHLDGIQLFGPRSEVSGSNRFSGSKRSNSDSHFTAQEHPETLHWSKLLRNGPGSLSMNVNPLANQPPRGQISHLLHQLSSSRFKDESVISQTAADEGSRTGVKTPGILTSFRMPNPSKLECFAPSNTANRKDLPTSTTKQMTIFYGGQAHVFDDVHPNKADVIMALAGSNGGSWSTDLSLKSKVKNTINNQYKGGQIYEGGSSRDIPFLAPEFRARPGHQATTAACNRIFTQPGREHQGSIISRGRDTREPVCVSQPEKKAT